MKKLAVMSLAFSLLLTSCGHMKKGDCCSSKKACCKESCSKEEKKECKESCDKKKT